MKTYLAKTFGTARVGFVLLGLLLISRLTDMGTTYWFFKNNGWDYRDEHNPALRELMRNFGFFPAAILNLLTTFAFLFISIALIQTTFLRAGYSQRCVRTIAQAMTLGITGASFVVSLHNLKALPFLPVIEWHAVLLSIVFLYMVIAAIPDLKIQMKRTRPPR